MGQNATNHRRAVTGHQMADGLPARDVRGIEADRKRLRGKYPSPYRLIRSKRPFIDDGD